MISPQNWHSDENTWIKYLIDIKISRDCEHLINYLTATSVRAEHLAPVRDTETRTNPAPEGREGRRRETAFGVKIKKSKEIRSPAALTFSGG